MALTAPDWLTRHDGTVKLGSDGLTWYVLLGDKPLYALVPRPADDEYTTLVKQTNNGKILATTKPAPTAEAALQAGLEELRKALGW
jgi:hypothetical protein